MISKHVIVKCAQVQREMAAKIQTSELPREDWDTWDPMLISEGLFSAANIFRYEHNKLCLLNCIDSIKIGHGRFNAKI